MKKLLKLYETVQNLKDLNFDIPEYLLSAISALEEEVINEEIIPKLSLSAMPALEKIRQPLKLIIYYYPEKELSIEFEKIKEENKDNLCLNNFEDLKEPILKEKPSIIRSAATNLIVFFSDGTEIREKTAAQTLIKSIEKIGPDKVKDLSIIINGINLVSKTKDFKYQQHLIEGGFYICTHSSTTKKKSILEEIADRLNIDFKVEII